LSPELLGAARKARPAGHCGLLADRLVELELVDSAARDGAPDAQNELKPWRKVGW
jgi:hypothetical protein